MKKKYFIIGGVFLLLIVSIIYYNFYKNTDDQKNIKFRSDTQQDTQVKNNEMMISKSLTNLMNTQIQDKPLKESDFSSKTTSDSGLSNQSGTITLKK
ncbi:hypothetical protein VXQ32_01155 [Acinetobacter oleivorans]|uniref:hypothetical protein n=1 Tax=Acinetobacter oleivorans TaxID=1148157 RepID=UPI003A870E4E